MPPDVDELLSTRLNFRVQQGQPCLLLRPGKPMANHVSVRVNTKAGEHVASLVQWAYLVRATASYAMQAHMQAHSMPACQGDRGRGDSGRGGSQIFRQARLHQRVEAPVLMGGGA